MHNRQGKKRVNDGSANEKSAPGLKKLKIKIDTNKRPESSTDERPYLNPLMKSQLAVIDKLSNFTAGNTHSVCIVKKAMPAQFTGSPDKLIPQRYKNNWYLKKDECMSSIQEVIAQEVFHACIPDQPKTRLVQSDGKHKLSVLSKEVPAFRPFYKISDYELERYLNSGDYYGLGDVLVISLLVGEGDLHRGNIGTNDKGRVIKIDGGLCFSQLYHEDRSYEITENDICLLPRINDYEPHNWLGLISYNGGDSSSVFKKHDFSNHHGIRHEINSSILRVSLLPDEVIKKIVHDCIPSSLEKLNADESSSGVKEFPVTVKDIAEECYVELLKRQSQLKNAGLNNKSFNKYLASTNAKDDLDNYLLYLKSYKTIGKRSLSIEKYEKDIYQHFEKMRSSVSRAEKNKHQFFKQNENTSKHDSLRPTSHHNLRPRQ